MIISKTINYTVKINMDLEETTPQNMQPSSSLTELYSTWTKIEIPFSIFIDLSNAFDTLDHNNIMLINKLQYYGIKGTALDLFQSCLSNRRQYVKIGNNKSDTTASTTGVPQGSILGPQLFIIYINDIIKFSTLFHTIIYADDTTLVGKFSLKYVMATL